MEDLLQNANNPVWHDGESTKLVYDYPLPRSPWKAGRWSLRDWRSMAERHVVVDHSGKRYGLLDGVPEAELYEMGGFWCAKSPQSHVGPFLNAVDFLIPDGTPVLAAQEGEILRVMESNTEWGDGSEFRDKVNFIDIVHASGEISEYCHLAPHSVSAFRLRVGSGVKKGQIIGTVGKTGWTDRDHLHLVVYRDDNGNPANPLDEGRKFKSLRIRFE